MADFPSLDELKQLQAAFPSLGEMKQLSLRAMVAYAARLRTGTSSRSSRSRTTILRN